METVLDRALDLEDLDATPDDGNCYEVLDGALVMTPPPDLDHQNALGELFVILHQVARPRGLRVIQAPFAWRIGPGQVPEPDLMVVRPEAVTRRAVVAAPVLVVEALSPHGPGRDLYEKRRIYAAGGAAWYWIVDPAEPSLTVLRLVADVYEEAARVAGAEAYEAEAPFPVRVVPAELLA
ncbi:MAG: Uma2 family endonuclease [Acidimicrobiales bacterium]